MIEVRDSLKFMIIALPILFFVTPTFAATIGFEGLTSSPDDFVYSAPHLEAGFVLTATSSVTGVFGSGVSDVNTTGTDVYGWCGSCGDDPIVLTLRHTDDRLFSITSLQATNLDPDDFQQGMGITIIGTLPGGGTVEGDFIFDENTFTTFVFPSSFTDLVSLDIHGFDALSPNLVIDNIVVNAVPIPGAVWLLGSGLIGLVGLRRKLKK